MAEDVQFTKPNRFNPNKRRVDEDWRLWKKEFLIYIELIGIQEKLSEKTKALLLLNLIGTEGIKAKANMTFNDPDEEENMEILLKKFDEIFDPPQNEIRERYKFFSRRKNDHEAINDYIAVLQKQAGKCNFGKQIDKFIIDMAILSMNSHLRQCLFSLENVSLQDVIQMYKYESRTNETMNMFLYDSKNFNLNLNKSDEKHDENQFSSSVVDNATTKQSESIFKYNICFDNNKYLINANDCISDSMSTCTSDVKKSNNEKQYEQSKFKECQGYGLNREDNKGSERNQDAASNSKPVNYTCGSKDPHTICASQNRNEERQTKRVCSKCATKHAYRQCPAYNKRCFKCNKLGHYNWTCKNVYNDEQYRCPVCTSILKRGSNDVYYCQSCKNGEINDSDWEDIDKKEVNQLRKNQHHRRRPNDNSNKVEDSCCIS